MPHWMQTQIRESLIRANSYAGMPPEDESIHDFIVGLDGEAIYRNLETVLERTVSGVGGAVLSERFYTGQDDPADSRRTNELIIGSLGSIGGFFTFAAPLNPPAQSVI